MTLASSIAIVCKALLAAALLTITCPLGASAAPNSINLQWTHGNAGGVAACGTYNGIGSADGCLGAENGAEIINAHLADPGAVIEISLVPGSGYSNGTYSITGTGCTGSGFAGTVTVSGGALSSYVISNEGAGYTCRPTIAVPAGAGGGSGGIITPAVEVTTPHNASTTYNLPGVDYGVGYAGALVVPTGGNVPAGVTVSGPPNAGSTVFIACAPCTLNGYDFSGFTVNIENNGGPIGTPCSAGDTNCTKITNSKVRSQPATLYAIQFGHNNIAACDVQLTNDDISDSATYGTSTNSSGTVAMSFCTGGSLIFTYNYCHEIYTKCIAGFYPSASGTLTVYEHWNYFRNMTMSTGGGHGEAEYMYSGNATDNVNEDDQFNVYHDQWDQTAQANGVNQQTATNAACHGDVSNLLSGNCSYNYAISPGPYAVTGSSNPTTYGITGSANFFVGGTYTSFTVNNNFLDYSGKLEPYNSTGATSPTGNINAATGNSCNMGSTCN